MRFLYQYKTSDGERHEGEIRVASREAVFTELKKQGIKPYGVELAPGFCNWVASLGKRVYAIGVLTILLVIAMGVAFSLQRKVQVVVNAAMPTEERRAQIYGDPLVMQTCEAKGWSNVFPNALEQVLAAYAIPAKDVNLTEVRALIQQVVTPLDLAPVSIDAQDSDEIARMKRMVNWMKKELAAYVEAGGTFSDYAERLQSRLEEERRVRARIETELSLLDHDEDYESQWEEKNKILRAMGIMPIPMPGEKDF